MMLGIVAQQAAGGEAPEPPPPGDFPVLLSQTETKFATAATTYPVSMPSSVDAGDLLIVQLVSITNTQTSAPGGWADLTFNSGGSLCSKWWYKVAVGTEGGTTENFTGTTAQRAVARTIRIQAGSFRPVSAAPLVASLASILTATTTPSSSTLAPPWGSRSHLWLTSYSTGNDLTSVVSYPANYENGSYFKSANGAGHANSIFASRELVADTESPGAFETTSSTSGRAETIAIAGNDDSLGAKSVTTTPFGSASTDHQVEIPAVLDGERLLCQFVNRTTSSVTTPSGWTLLNSTAAAAESRASWYYRDVSADADATTVNFVTSGSCEAVGIVYQLKAGSFNASQAPEISSASSNIGSSIGTNTLTQSWGSTSRTLYISGYAIGAIGNATAYPTNHINRRVTGQSSANASTGCAWGAAMRYGVLASQGSANFTHSSSGWSVAHTVAVRLP